MTTIELSELLEVVLATRDEIEPDLDGELLEAIVNAEAVAEGDGDAAMQKIDAAVTAAMDRGAGQPNEAATETTNDEDEA